VGALVAFNFAPTTIRNFLAGNQLAIETHSPFKEVLVKHVIASCRHSLNEGLVTIQHTPVDWRLEDPFVSLVDDPGVRLTLLDASAVDAFDLPLV
jgi:hypothetical protein